MSRRSEVQVFTSSFYTVARGISCQVGLQENSGLSIKRKKKLKAQHLKIAKVILSVTKDAHYLVQCRLLKGMTVNQLIMCSWASNLINGMKNEHKV